MAPSGTLRMLGTLGTGGGGGTKRQSVAGGANVGTRAALHEREVQPAS